MRIIYIILSILIISGCSQKEIVHPTTTTLMEEYMVFLPVKTVNITTTTCMKPIFTTTNTTTTNISTTTLNPLIETFQDNSGEICSVDGKPIIRMFSKTTCLNCKWSEPIFDRVISEYVEEGLIAGHHWVFDRKDDVLTTEYEGFIPDDEYDVFFDVNKNPSNTVPYFSFGCRFTRVGNGYQVRNKPEKEEREYKAVIEQLLL
jgi:hypothetical protein